MGRDDDGTGGRVQLLQGEELLSTLRPVPLSFFGYYLIALLPIIWSFSYLTYIIEEVAAAGGFGEELLSGSLWESTDGIAFLLAGLSIIGAGGLLGGRSSRRNGSTGIMPVLRSALLGGFIFVGGTEGLTFLLWFVGLLFLALIANVVTTKVDVRPLALFTIIGLTVLALPHAFEISEDGTLLGQDLILMVSTIGSILLLLGIDIYRRSHVYTVTNLRMILRKGLFTFDERRVMFKNITDLDVHISILGRIFNYGDIIPVTASGFGLGSNRVAFSFEAGRMVRFGGEASAETQTGRAQTFDMLHGIPNPHTVSHVLSKLVYENSSEFHMGRIRDSFDGHDR